MNETNASGLTHEQTMEQLRRMTAGAQAPQPPAAAQQNFQPQPPMNQPMNPPPYQPQPPATMQPQPTAPAAAMAPVHYPPPGYPAQPMPGYQPQPMAPPALPPAVGFMVPMKVNTQLGVVKALVMFGPEWAANAQSAEQLIAALQYAGWPVDAWQKQQGGGGGGWGGGGGRGRY